MLKTEGRHGMAKTPFGKKNGSSDFWNSLTQASAQLVKWNDWDRPVIKNGVVMPFSTSTAPTSHINQKTKAVRTAKK